MSKPRNFPQRVYAERGGRARPTTIDVGAATGTVGGLSAKAQAAGRIARKVGLALRTTRAISKGRK